MKNHTNNQTWRKVGRLATVFAVMGAAVALNHLMASPFGGAVTQATNETTGAARTVGAALGGIVTVIGGGYAAWEAGHSRPFTTPLVCAIAGAVIAGVCII